MSQAITDMQNTPLGKRSYLKKSAQGWYTGCGCGGVKPKDIITPPAGSVELFLNANAPIEGPVTGFTYYPVPNTTSIDIDARDAVEFRKRGIAGDPRPGFQGMVTRDESTRKA